MKKFISLTSLLILCLCASKGSAEELIPQSVEQLTEKAELIVLGKVESTTVKRDQSGRIYTLVEISVTDIWKGTWKNKSVTVLLSGGTLGAEKVHVSGQVKYEVGEEVVSFLVFNPKGDPVTLGMSQGKRRVTVDPKSKEKKVEGPESSVVQADPSLKTAESLLKLSLFKARVEAAK
jgi:hypothetical protein